MGQLLTSLNSIRNNDVLVPELGFDIESASPGSDELTLYHELAAILVEPTQTLLKLLEKYQPFSDVIEML
ncbi:unnamed protein product [Cunninghamella echinulata]